MTKPKPKTAEPTFIVHAHQLSDRAKQKLVELIASDNNQAIRKVEMALGLGIDGMRHLDEVPRPADYIAAFKPLGKKALELCDALRELSGHYTKYFTERNVKQDAIEAALLELHAVANNVIKEFQGKPSKGARKNNALAEVIRRLRRIFRRYYGGPVDKRRKSGALSYRSDAEKHEIEFVKIALNDARLITKGYTGLEGLFRDPRCALPEEREQTIERIVHKVQNRRKKADI
jgi:hypothetical protein